MNCPSCHQEVMQQSAFCPHCGGRLVDDQALEEAAVEDANFPVPSGQNDPNSAQSRFQQAAASRQGDDDHDEEDIWSGSYSPKAMVGWWVAAGVTTLVALIVGVVYFSNAFGYVLLAIGLGWVILVGRYAYRRLGVHYYLTSQRFLHESGILWRRTDRIELIDIDDVTFHQGPVQRMFNVGTIHLSSSDKTDPEMDLPGIEGVRRVADLIDDLRRKERRRRGLHIEAV